VLYRRLMSAVEDAIRRAIAEKIRDAKVDVAGASPGHFQIAVASPAFDGLSTLERHRLVLQAIKDLMSGDAPPVHAIDSLKTSVS
jgi:stress-induced morphogen